MLDSSSVQNAHQKSPVSKEDEESKDGASVVEIGVECIRRCWIIGLYVWSGRRIDVITWGYNLSQVTRFIGLHLVLFKPQLQHIELSQIVTAF